MNAPKAKTILEDLRSDIIKHPAFDQEIYEQHDIDAAIEEGGDTCSLLSWAWQLDEAIKLLGTDR